jgi:hypothetical protein
MFTFKAFFFTVLAVVPVIILSEKFQLFFVSRVIFGFLIFVHAKTFMGLEMGPTAAWLSTWYNTYRSLTHCLVIKVISVVIWQSFIHARPLYPRF